MPLSNASAETIWSSTYITSLSAAFNAYDPYYSSSTPVLQSIASQGARDAFFTAWAETISQYRRLTYSPVMSSAATTVSPASAYRTPINLLDGRVFIAPNLRSSLSAYSPLIYNPTTNTFSGSAATWPSHQSSTLPRFGFPCLLADGRVFLPPGVTTGSLSTLTPREGVVWDPVTDTITLTPTLSHSTSTMVFDAPPILLPSGKVLCLGKGTTSAASNRHRLYNPTTNAWENTTGTYAGTYAAGLNGASLMANGNVVATGTSGMMLIDGTTGGLLASFADTLYTIGGLHLTQPNKSVVIPANSATHTYCRAIDHTRCTATAFPYFSNTSAYNNLSNPTNYAFNTRGCTDITGRIWRVNSSATTTSTNAYYFDPYAGNFSSSLAVTYNMGGIVLMNNGKLLAVPNVSGSAFRIISPYGAQTVPTIPSSILCSPFINKAF